jgi:hypothetical protein
MDITEKILANIIFCLSLTSGTPTKADLFMLSFGSCMISENMVSVLSILRSLIFLISGGKLQEDFAALLFTITDMKYHINTSLYISDK